MTTALRPLSTGELLDRTFSLYRSHFGLFVGIFALPYLVVLAFRLVGLVFQSQSPQISNILMNLVWSMGALFLILIVSAASQAAAVVAVSNLHLDRPASVMDSFSTVKGEIPGVIGVSLLVGMASGVAFFAFIVPGVLLLIMWSLAVPAKVLEHRSATDSMSRSMELTKGSRGRIFVIGLLIFVLSIGVSWLLQWPILIAAGFSLKTGIQRMAIGWQVAALVAEFVSRSLVGALGTIALSLVYYDQRVRKEAFDLQLMMSTIDASAVPSSPAQVGA
ncbi:MAG TPA: hypothetical protein VNX87_23335 [Candidatus Sulfotelmatobacter sp.]|jgi:hypothetical protein|nr:hypothetical protein [Candidatus Sulfotelmatobacter sp.]